MKHYAYSGLSFQHIQYFIAVAEQGTMNRAAETLHVSQPLLSQKIAQLEQLIGIQLFQREKQRLKLTPAGELMLQEWRNILHMFETSIARGEAIQKDQISPIIFGWSNGIEQKTIRPCIHALQNNFPNIPVTWRLIDIYNLLRELVAGEIDLAAIPDFGQVRSEPKVDYINVVKLPLSLIHSKLHPLAQKERVDWADLKPYPIILPHIGHNENFTEELMRNCRRAGFVPFIQYCEEETLTIQFQIIQENGVTFLLSHGYESEDFMERDMESDVDHYLVLAWRMDAPERVINYARSAAPYIETVYHWRRSLLKGLKERK